VVFATEGIPAERRENQPFWHIPADQFYIKRLVGLSGETLRIDANRHLVVDGRTLTASDRHFENIYSFDPKTGPMNSRYSGHISEHHMPFFPNHETSYRIGDGKIMVMGDNTVSSLDSRYWGDFPETSVIGKSFFVYWPITERFGWGQD
jgi:signal peptidase I